MVDARLPDWWLGLEVFDELPDRLFRIHVSGLQWSAGHGTDGGIPRTALRYLHPEGAQRDDADALVTAGLWAADGNGFMIVNWKETQSMAADLRHQRDRKRDNQRDLRARKAQERKARTDRVTGDVAGDVTGDKPVTSPISAKARQGITPLAGRSTLPASRSADSDASRYCEHNMPFAECTYDDNCRRSSLTLRTSA